MNRRYLVSPSEYDDIGAVLREFGKGFEYDSCEWENLCDWTFLRNYEVVYLNCAQVFEQADYRARLAPALREFVDRGGTLYASDWALTVVCEAFPGRLGIDLGGEEGDFACVVNDRGLKEFLGNEMSIHFDMPAWAMLQELHHDVRVFIEARDLRRTNPRELRLPVVAGFESGDGHVLATSFHNEQQLSERERRLLRFLALRPALAGKAHATSALMKERNARVEAEFIETVDRGRFSTVMRFPSDGRPLLAMLNWQGDAELRLCVQGPDGRMMIDRISSSTPFGGEVVGAGHGVVECRVEGVRIPHDNFPFVLTFATAQQAAPPPPPPPRPSGPRGVKPAIASAAPRSSLAPPPPPPPLSLTVPKNIPPLGGPGITQQHLRPPPPPPPPPPPRSTQ
jgi:hypothetical protein